MIRRFVSNTLTVISTLFIVALSIASVYFTFMYFDLWRETGDVWAAILCFLCFIASGFTLGAWTRGS